MISVIVPAHREPYLWHTVNSLLVNAVGDIEVIPVIDGTWLEGVPPKDPRVKTIFLQKAEGMRGAINAGLAVAKGEFIMKSDAHCCFSEGYDEVLTGHCDDNWLMIPRRFALNEKDWEPTKLNYPRDYHYWTFPGDSDPAYGYAFQVSTYPDGRVNRLGIDDTMTFQGSCFLGRRKYFMKHVGFLDAVNYGTFTHDQAEVGLAYWLSGGEVKTINKCWYAHLFKQKRHYKSRLFSRKGKKDEMRILGAEYATRHWMLDQHGKAKFFSWLVDKFQPLPGWEGDWQGRYREKLNGIRGSQEGVQPGASGAGEGSGGQLPGAGLAS